MDILRRKVKPILEPFFGNTFLLKKQVHAVEFKKEDRAESSRLLCQITDL